MNPSKQACSVYQRLSKSTLLALLNSKIDTSKVVVVSSGQVIDVTNIPSVDVNVNIHNGVWVYYEEYQPKRMLMTNPNWNIASFDSKSRMVCVQIYSKSGFQVLSIDLPEPAPKF
jgi:hypothetical protein